MILSGLICYKEYRPVEIVVQKLGLGIHFFDILKSLLGHFEHLVPVSEVHRSRRTGFDARRQETFLNPVDAHRAFCHTLCLFVPAGDIPWAGIFYPFEFLGFYLHLRIIQDRTGSLVFGYRFNTY